MPPKARKIVINNSPSPVQRLQKIETMMRHLGASLEPSAETMMAGPKLAMWSEEMQQVIAQLLKPVSNYTERSALATRECQCGHRPVMGYFGDARCVECLNCGLRSPAHHQPSIAVTNWDRTCFVAPPTGKRA